MSDSPDFICCVFGCGDVAETPTASHCANHRPMNKPTQQVEPSLSFSGFTGMTTEDRFWPKVHKTDGCWEWLGGHTTKGYGTFWMNGKDLRAHRASWEIHNGKIPEHDSYHGMMVCHGCDNPGCVNPEHLFLGTQQDNMDDMIRKGRSANAVGANNGNAKLTEDDVIEMKALHKTGRSFAEIGRAFSVSGQHVSLVVRGIKRSHL